MAVHQANGADASLDIRPDVVALAAPASGDLTGTVAAKVGDMSEPPRDAGKVADAVAVRIPGVPIVAGPDPKLRIEPKTALNMPARNVRPSEAWGHA